VRLPPEPGHPARPRLKAVRDLNAVRVEVSSPGSGGTSLYQEHLNLFNFMVIMENHVLQGNSNRPAHNLVDATFRMDFADEI
jgi:hypothetical protein